MPSKRTKKRAPKKKAPKKKAITKRFSIKAQHPGGDLVSIQISARLERVPKGMKISKALLADMVRRKADTSYGFWDGATVVGATEGDDPPGIKLKIVRWSNPNRLTASGRGWRTGSQAQAWGSLRQAIGAATIAFR